MTTLSPRRTRHLDSWSLTLIGTTLLLFMASLLTTGFAHDMLLESGVFLVSLKLISMSYKLSVSTLSIQRKLDTLLAALPPGGPDGTHTDR